MKVIHVGGVNTTLGKDDPNYAVYGYGNYFMVQLKDQIDQILQAGGKVAVCVATRADKHYFDSRFLEMGYNLDQLTILGRDDSADWPSYQAILLFGGSTRELYDWMIRTKFSVGKLKDCELLAGESAGAYVLASKILVNYDAEGTKIEIIDGFIPELPILVLAHTNNPYYCTPELKSKLGTWCEDHQVDLVGLAENEMREVIL